MFYFWSRHGTTHTTFASAVYALTASTSSTRLAHARAASDTAATNRGGIATVAFTGARLQQRHRSNRLCTSDVWRRVARRVRPLPAVGSATVSTLFADLSDVSDCLATFEEPLFIVGGLSVHLVAMPSVDDMSVSQLVDLLADYGLAYHVPAHTHDLRGLLDVVASRNDLRPPSVDVIDVGLSDHRLLRWPVSKRRPTPVCTTTVVRP